MYGTSHRIISAKLLYVDTMLEIIKYNTLKTIINLSAMLYPDSAGDLTGQVSCLTSRFNNSGTWWHTIK